MKAIRIHEHGSPEVLVHEEVAEAEPGPGQAAVRVEAAGVNYIDVYHRTGLYPVGPLPATIGVEAAGVVTRLGQAVASVRDGERVAFAGPLGAYAQSVVVPAERLVPVPDAISLETAAAALLQGLTAHYLTRSTFPLGAGHVCLVHAAAGGVGLLLCQMARQRGAHVIGTVSTEDKAALAREAGAHDVIVHSEAGFETEVRRITAGRGVHVVYDGVGRATFEGSLACLCPRGMLVLFGQASGTVPPIDPSVLASRGSLFLTRPSLFHYVSERSELLQRAHDLFEELSAGRLQARIGGTFPLEDAAHAHRALESRRSSGKLLLRP